MKDSSYRRGLQSSIPPFLQCYKFSLFWRGKHLEFWISNPVHDLQSVVRIWIHCILIRIQVLVFYWILIRNLTVAVSGSNSDPDPDKDFLCQVKKYLQFENLHAQTGSSNMKFQKNFLLWGGGGQIGPVWIWIRWLKWIRIQSGSAFGSETLSTDSIEFESDRKPWGLCIILYEMEFCSWGVSQTIRDRKQWFDLQYVPVHKYGGR